MSREVNVTPEIEAFHREVSQGCIRTIMDGCTSGHA